MISGLAFQFHVHIPCLCACLAYYLSLSLYLEVLHAPVVHQLLADLPGGGPPEEHVHQQQEEDRGVEYRQRGGAHLKMGLCYFCTN